MAVFYKSSDTSMLLGYFLPWRCNKSHQTDPEKNWSGSDCKGENRPKCQTSGNASQTRLK